MHKVYQCPFHRAVYGHGVTLRNTKAFRRFARTENRPEAPIFMADANRDMPKIWALPGADSAGGGISEVPSPLGRERLDRCMSKDRQRMGWLGGAGGGCRRKPITLIQELNIPGISLTSSCAQDIHTPSSSPILRSTPETAINKTRNPEFALAFSRKPPLEPVSGRIARHQRYLIFAVSEL